MLALVLLPIVFMAAQSSNIEVNVSPAAYPEFTSYSAEKKTLYVWSHSTQSRIGNTPAWVLLAQNNNGEMERLADFCTLHGFTNVVLFAGSVEWEYEDYYSKGVLPHESDYVYDIQYLASRGISTDLMVYLNDDPNNMTNYQHIESVARIAQRLRDEGLPFGVLHIDQEPSKQNRYTDFLRMLNIASQYVTVGVSLKPQWLKEKLSSITAHFSVDRLRDEMSIFRDYVAPDDATFSDLVLMLSLQSIVMAYSNNTEESIIIGKRAVDSLARANTFLKRQVKTMEFAIETGYINDLPETETMHYWIKKNKALWFNKLGCFYKSLFSYAQRNGVDAGLAIHDYSQYYTTLYCVTPADDTQKQTLPYNVCRDEAGELIINVLNGCRK